MIVPAQILETVFAQIPAIQLNTSVTRTPSFGWGDIYELTKYLIKKGEATYPLIWLLETPPSTDEESVENGTLLIKDVRIVLATRETRSDLLASERYNKSFKYVLNPLAEYVAQAIDSCTATTKLEDSWTLARFTDYSYRNLNGSDGGAEAATLDTWDAINLQCRVEFNDNCINTIKWITPTIT